MDRDLRLIGCLFVAVLSCLPLQAERPGGKPNVILIMADDIGAEGLKCYGNSVFLTPHLDRLAANGAVFENAYATPLCTPTRVMLMAGLYPNRTGYRALMSKDREARIPRELRTFGDYFGSNGYRTAIAGKWQLGQFDVYPNQPAEHGFDRHCMWKWWFEGSKTSRYYEPGIWQDSASRDGDADTFGPDVYTDFLLDFIRQERQSPYFVYFPMALVHSPFLAPPALKEAAYAKYHDGMDGKTRNFGHMVTYMDMLVGRIVAAVEEAGQTGNTLVIFTGDNGCHKQITSRLGDMDLKGGKGSMTEAGTRVPLICYWPGIIPPGRRHQFFSLVDILPTVAALADIAIGQVDGMDLSHNLLNTEGRDRDHVFVLFRTASFVRDRRFRLNHKGELFDIPVASDQSRYSERISPDPENQAARARLQELLDSYLAIPPM